VRFSATDSRTGLGLLFVLGFFGSAALILVAFGDTGRLAALPRHARDARAGPEVVAESPRAADDLMRFNGKLARD
jgi:hypothetical protein